MWALLWNGWKLGKETICHEDLQFAWATSSKNDWNKFNIFHNAGVTTDVDGLFYKANYMSQLPYFADGSTYLKDRCSYKYFEFMKKVGEKSCLL
jgi:hypothetical protein